MNGCSDVRSKPHVHTKKCLPHTPAPTFLKKSPHLFAEKLPYPHTNRLQLRRQKYGSSKEDEPMNYVEQAKTLVQTLVHFFQVQDKIDKLDSDKSKKESFLLKKVSH